jgi:hypothetical protein
VQLGRPLSPIFDAHGKRALEALSRIDDILRNLAPDNPFLRAWRIWNCPPATFAVATSK